jgi:cellulose synthase/poly-beta-1,6-N-acetylglucosamine synthase-like glycosyltransferase
VGASAGLYGNGMVFDAELIENREWSGHLIEDAEFQMELLLDGHRVTYVPDAKLEAEMPDSLRGATTQNERWELGRLQLARRYVPELLKRAIRGDRAMRAAHWDAVLDHVVPPLSILVATNAAVGSVSWISRVVRGRAVDRLAFTLSTLSSVLLVVHVAQGLRSVRAPRWVYRSLLSAPRLVLWKVLLYARVAARPGDVAWTRTERNTVREPA